MENTKPKTYHIGLSLPADLLAHADQRVEELRERKEDLYSRSSYVRETLRELLNKGNQDK